MARKNFAIEQGLDINTIDGDVLVSLLAGTAAPGGDTGPQDDAPIGTSYQRSNGELYLKFADANEAADWEVVPVVLSSGYTPANGDPAVGDSFEEAIEFLDGNQDDIQTLTGAAQGAEDYGSSFTGDIIPDSSNIQEALQSLETYAESIEPGQAVEVTGITTLQDIDTVLVDEVHSAEWEVVAFEEATPANKSFNKVTALHDGTASADATESDNTVHTKLKVGSNFNLVIEIDLNGTGAAQTMRLRASSSTAGVTIQARRTSVLESI